MRKLLKNNNDNYLLPKEKQEKIDLAKAFCLQQRLPLNKEVL